MELRTFLLIAAVAAFFHGSAVAGPVQRYPLDDRAVYSVQVGTDAPTTVIFPGPITAVDGAGVSTKAEDASAILISHQPGTRFFSVRASNPEAAGAVNVIFRDRVFAFSFTTSGDPDRTLTLFERGTTAETMMENRITPDRLLALIDQVRDIALLDEQYPALTQRIERTRPHTRHVSGPISTCVEEVFRFADEDVVVLRVRLENHGEAALRYAPARLAVQISDTVLPVVLTDARGELPAGTADVVTLVLTGASGGTRLSLSVKNTFTVVVPALE